MSAANWTRVQIVLMWELSRKAALGQLDLGAGDVGFAGLGGEVGDQSAGWRPRLVPPLSARESLGLKGRAAQPPTWKGLVRGARAAERRGGRAGDRHLVAGGRVEGEVGAVDRDRDRADVERDALDDLGQGVGDSVDLGGLGFDVEGGAANDGAEVEGAGDRRGDDREAERGAFVGAG